MRDRSLRAGYHEVKRRGRSVAQIANAIRATGCHVRFNFTLCAVILFSDDRVYVRFELRRKAFATIEPKSPE